MSFHRIPKNLQKKAVWLQALDLNVDVLTLNSRVCSRHFPEGDPKKVPSLTLGKRFASPKKLGPRAKRARDRDEQRQLREHSMTPASEAACSSRSVTPAPPPAAPTPPLHELSNSSEVLVNTALLSRIEVLEAENARLKTQQKISKHFRIEAIQHNDKLVRFYTGFVSFMVFLAFFDFLGPVVEHLNYWGSKEGVRQRRRARKLDPRNQLFLTLVKLKLNLKVTDLAFRFGLSASLTSRYITTWICFLYHHFRELDWMPAVDQVLGTLPSVFRERYPTTFAIIDGSEVFIETPSDLHMQSSTWSQYKHHNTVKFLVACTPNGAISYISPVYVGSISDVDLTRTCGFLTSLKDKPGISIMADRGFTIKDMLKELNIELNIPPFLEGRQQLPAQEVEKGRTIASLRIHVERAIGRIKTFEILKGVIPLSMARITNQIVCVCAALANFQPALVPLPTEFSESDVEKYFEQLSDRETDSDSDTD